MSDADHDCDDDDDGDDGDGRCFHHDRRLPPSPPQSSLSHEVWSYRYIYIYGLCVCFYVFLAKRVPATLFAYIS